jgi:ElaB/YqjD/DUF883 family membrane-anchored ribosome-binding protein
MTDRILDKDLEDNIKGAFDKQMHESKKTLTKAGHMLQDKQRGLEESVGQRPYEWVAGAFLVGILLGKLLTRSNGDR